MSLEITNKPLMNAILRDLWGYLLATLAGIVPFIGFIAFVFIVLALFRYHPMWDPWIFAVIFIAPGVLSAILSIFILRRYIKSIGDASIFGAFASATFGYLFLIAFQIAISDRFSGEPSPSIPLYTPSLNDLITVLFVEGLLLLMFEFFFAVAGVVTGAVGWKLLCFLTKRKLSR